MKKLSVRRRFFLFGLLSFVWLTGCSQLTYDLQKTWEYAMRKNQDVVLTQKEIQQYPYTSVYGRLGKQAQILIVLGYIDDTGAVRRYHWITGSRESVTTEQGRIVETSGLWLNIAGVSETELDPLRCVAGLYYYNQNHNQNQHPKTTECDLQWVRQMDFVGGPGAGTETLISKFEFLGEVELDLPQGSKKVLHVKETGRFVFAREAFINEFWLEEDGHVVKSKQQLHPGSASLELTQVKWVGRDGD